MVCLKKPADCNNPRSLGYKSVPRRADHYETVSSPPRITDCSSAKRGSRNRDPILGRRSSGVVRRFSLWSKPVEEGSLGFRMRGQQFINLFRLSGSSVSVSGNPPMSEESRAVAKEISLFDRRLGRVA